MEFEISIIKQHNSHSRRNF